MLQDRLENGFITGLNGDLEFTFDRRLRFEGAESSAGNEYCIGCWIKLSRRLDNRCLNRLERNCSDG